MKKYSVKSQLPGFVPFYGNAYNRMFGRAYGYDLLGHFNQFTNHYGPFGFWANFYHDRR